jgi:rod shape-determining protein MreD
VTGDRWHPAQLLLGLPGLLTLLLVLIGAVPIGAPLIGPVLPAFGLVAVFVFAIHRPDLMPHWLAFLIGVIQDLVIGGPLGLNALLLLSVQGICSSQRRFLAGRPFWLVWLGFALIALPAAVAQWLIACAYLTALVPIRDSLMQATVTLALFPIVAAPLMMLSNRLGREAAA